MSHLNISKYSGEVCPEIGFTLGQGTISSPGRQTSREEAFRFHDDKIGALLPTAYFASERLYYSYRLKASGPTVVESQIQSPC